MRSVIDKFARLFIVPIVSLALVVQPVPAFAANAYSLSAMAKLTPGSEPLPTFAAENDHVTPIQVRDHAWGIADLYPPERYELDALVDALDYDAEQAFVFLRDAIKFDPYQGVLRGSHGALGGQAGNAIDRSLLLKEILDTMGMDSRLVFGTLSNDAARRLLSASAQAPASGEFGPLSGAQLAVARAALRAYNWLVSVFNDDAIGELVTTAGIADIKNHAWVQMKKGAEWIDLDSAFPDAEIGSSYAEPERYATEPPAEDMVSMTFSVIAETLTSGQLSEEVVLQQVLSAADAERSKIFLYFQPFGAGTGRTLAEALGPDARFQPVIQVGDSRTSGKPIPGILLAPQQMTEAKKFFYGSDNAVTSALYLSVEARALDGNVDRERRVLFDRVPANRRIRGTVDVSELQDIPKHSGTPIAFLEFHQILVSTGGSNPRTVWNDAGYAAWFPEKLKELGDEEVTTEQFLWQLGMFQAVYPTISEEFAIPALNDLPNARFFVGVPRVFIMTMAALQEGDEIRTQQSIDLLLDDIQVVSAGASPKQLAQRNRWYGVLQSALETAAIGSMANAAGYGAESVASAFNQTQDKPVVLATVDDLKDSVQYPARLVADLRADRVVVHGASARQAVETWWTISPPDGSTKAMLGPGLGGGRYGGSGGSRRIGGTPSQGGNYRILPDGRSINLDRPKPSAQPPGKCKGGGTEYLNVLCNISLRQINPVVLLAIGVVVAAFVVIMILRQITLAKIEAGGAQPAE